MKSGMMNSECRIENQMPELHSAFCIPHSALSANATEGAAAQPMAVHPMATMLSRSILQDGEIIILTLKPSLLYIPFSCLPLRRRVDSHDRLQTLALPYSVLPLALAD